MGSSDVIASGKELILIMEDRWLSVEKISVYFGVTKDTVHKWLREKISLLIKWVGFGSSRKRTLMCRLKTKQILIKNYSGILKRSSS